jgi:hypothetical protein
MALPAMLTITANVTIIPSQHLIFMVSLFLLPTGSQFVSTRKRVIFVELKVGEDSHFGMEASSNASPCREFRVSGQA